MSADTASANSRPGSWPASVPEPRGPTTASEWQELVSVVAAAHELAACPDLDGMLRRAVELARERIGLERVGLFIRDPSDARPLLRGTWGTGTKGETIDERGADHECDPREYDMLLRIQTNGALWLYHEHVPYVAEAGDPGVIGYGWLVLTPLLMSRNLVGVMYNDAAISYGPVDEGKQARAAVFCSLLAGVFAARGAAPFPTRQREVEASVTVKHVLSALKSDPLASGERLARELGISSGHLARSFKSEMGVSLVEYRNRLRIERFFGSLDSGSGKSLLDAALSAGFGSYAQFHRVYRKFLGKTPREDLAGRRRTNLSRRSRQ